MKEEVREEGQVAPEIEAVWARLEYLAEELQKAAADSNGTFLGIFVEHIQTWSGILESGDVVASFRQQVSDDVKVWCESAKEKVGRGKFPGAVKDMRQGIKTLVYYAELLGVEIPPEEEAPSAAEEVKPVEERPWEELEISKEGYERPLREVLGSGREAEPTYNSFARFRGVTAAGPALDVLNEEGWRSGSIRFIGPKRIRLLREKFTEAGYPVPSEAGNRELIKVFVRSE